MQVCDLSQIHRYTKQGIVATIGNFDGVHLGHRYLFAQLKNYALQHKAATLVITFEPHPKSVLFKNTEQYRLTLADEKQKLIANCGIDYYVQIPFTHELAEVEYDVFLSTIINQPLEIKMLCLGNNHKFGKEGKGTTDKVAEFFKDSTTEVVAINDFFLDKEKVTSTILRKLIKEGNISAVNQRMDSSYSFFGIVVQGETLGRKIGFPTANLSVSKDKILPRNGVYAVKVILEGEEYKGMMNIGTRPTVVNNGTSRIEIHIFNFNREIYNQTVHVFPLQFIREERKMSSLSELEEQLKKDNLTVLSYF